MRHRIVGVALALAALSRPTNAQIARRQQPIEPQWWTSVGLGVFQSQAVDDGRTASTWDFGSTVQWRATVERTLDRGTALGVAATFARAPLTYSSDSFQPTSCTSCDADANVTQVMATFHAGGASPGFHQVIEIGLGATIYSGFRARGDGRKLDPGSDADPAFALGYGFGYGIGEFTQLEVVQDLAASMHESTGLPADANTLIRSWTTRLGVRVALGR